MEFDIKNLVEEDIDNCFSDDPNNRFYKKRCYNFAKTNLHRFVKILDQDEIPFIAKCKCGEKGNWEAYWYWVWKCEFDKNGELTTIRFDQDYLDYFFDGDPKKAGKEADWNPEMFDKLYILGCKKCASWYVWIV
ncbi:hypothetical protein [Desulfosporosinus sp. FKA]|uniref:hypothetical protein n=1 Tax=Desulfosporosinus sp. FKA TaxID=1969834 RepID=UPI000B49F46D|nr:hypothetical protein [Desulfosporosinus sp. FKA]